MSEDVGAAILAGGQSKRLGQNKALVKLWESGPFIVQMVVRQLAEARLGAPLLVTNSPEEFAFLGVECVGDDITGAGALGGIFTALNHARHSKVLVVACDMPFLNVELLRHMVSLPGDYDALVPRWGEGAGEKVEPLHAVYSVECAGIIEAQIAAGRLKVSNFLRNVNVRYLDEDELRKFDPSLRSFFNLNTPEDWEAARE